MNLSSRGNAVKNRRKIDHFLSFGPGAGMLAAGTSLLSSSLHESVGYVLLGVGFTWAGLAWVGFIVGGRE